MDKESILLTPQEKQETLVFCIRPTMSVISAFKIYSRTSQIFMLKFVRQILSSMVMKITNLENILF